MKDTDCLSTKHRMPPPPSCFNKKPEGSLSMGDVLADSAPSLKSWHMAFSQPSTDPACSSHQCLSPPPSALPWQQLREGALALPCLWTAKCQRAPPFLSLGSEAVLEAKPRRSFSVKGQRKRVWSVGKSFPKAGVLSHSPPNLPPTSTCPWNQTNPKLARRC